MVKTVKRVTNVDLKFEALNAINAPGNHPVITIKGKGAINLTIKFLLQVFWAEPKDTHLRSVFY
jgi:hypothetical protein